MEQKTTDTLTLITHNNDMTNTDLTLNNFTEQTGKRFRVNNVQLARIALTALDDDYRQTLVGLNHEDLATRLKANSPKGNPFSWVKEVPSLLAAWSSDLELTREGAFDEFIKDGGIKRLQDNNNCSVPNEIYMDPDLTLENFTDKAKALTGKGNNRFRVSSEQKQRIADGNLTREQAFTETVAAKQQQLSNPVS